MMFEVQDLAVASPATVSRCGMVYLEPSILGLKPFVECWLKRLPKAIENYGDKLEGLFDKFLEVRRGNQKTSTLSYRHFFLHGNLCDYANFLCVVFLILIRSYSMSSVSLISGV